ncbi:AP-5 complex subunit zeta-1-like isoform X2 [Gigantopelta aegis]|uniref:AP-5 complex subunit zeta-1-like isoform X2 n=1 Tax=Gigantopelta aegis TaxID=1735272 RepID=UPI001B88C518|nr:AP-5 complex subunit zeta-1-like isoform X2 [Gigantopelta aegis]
MLISYFRFILLEVRLFKLKLYRMALSAVENLQHQARNASQEDIDKLCKNITDTFHVAEKTSECLGYLRSLFFILQASDEEPCIPQELLVAMVTAVGSTWDRQNTRQCALCQQIISELLPREDSNVLFDEAKPVNKNLLPFCLIQGKRLGCLERSFNTAVKWVISQGFDFESQKKAFSFLVGVVTLHKEIVAEDCVRDTSNRISKWLMNASLQQAPNPYTLNPFRKDKSNAMTEIDGTPSRNFFTVLNIGKYYTDDQFLNIYSFSLVYQWLYYTQQALSEDSDHSKSSQVAMVTQVFEALVTKTIDYCFRVFDQCERKPKVQSDAEVQTACLSEAVKILDLVCSIDEAQVPRVYQEVKRLYTRISQNAALSTVNLQILQFFLNHSAVVVHDPGEAYEMFFKQVLSQRFQDPGLAFDVIRFTLDNLETLSYKTNILSKYFPNFLKLLAWHPRTFLTEFVDILPAFMSPTTSMEIFHTLLDLPCMTAALEILEKVPKTESQTSVTSSLGDVEVSVSTGASQNPLYRPLFNFITRAEGGCGDTISRLSTLYQVLQDMKINPRVRVCGQTVPCLLRVWFSVVLEEAGDDFASQLLLVFLERSGLLYDIPDIGYQLDVRRLLSENLVCLIKKYPVVVVSQYSEITDFLAISRNITELENIFSNLVWAVGEFCSVQCHAGCSANLTGQYYVTLEALIYEVSANLTSAAPQERSSPKVMSVLMSAVAKLATRCQDLIPRAILCLTKVAKQHVNNSDDQEGAAILVSRAQELINLLKLPNFASLVLNPTQDIDTGRWHRDNMSLPIVLRRTHRLLCPSEK